jgi:hypothetical protein
MQKNLRRMTGIVVNQEVVVVNMFFPMHRDRLTMLYLGFQFFKVGNLKYKFILCK